MLKTYRIIPLVFILFLFGFTFITVSPVFASEVAELNARIAELEAENALLKGGGTPDTHAHTAMKKLVNAGLEGCEILKNKCRMLNIENRANNRIIDQRRKADFKSWQKKDQAKKVCPPDPNYDGKRFCRANPDARSYQECVGRC
jgi:hypothetical protein